ncbi:MAG: 50S ribosomal protein L1, partial [Pseudomonadota bacterium]|nr:50S ribosomal protein L1 [Pseudomonadota bacterium]
MAKLSKRVKAIKAKVDRNKSYGFDNAVALIKEFATAKFNESIDVSVQLGVDPKKSDQVVRGSVVLPAGTGKTV